MPNNFNDNSNKKNLNGDSISFTTYRTNYSNDEMMKNNGGVPSSGSDINFEANKEVNITENGDIEITPTVGKDAMKKVTAHVDVAGGSGIPNPFIMGFGNYEQDYEMISSDLTKLKLLVMDVSDGTTSGWQDFQNITQPPYPQFAHIGKNAVQLFTSLHQHIIINYFYDGKMYKGPSPSELARKQEFLSGTELTSQADTPTSDTPSGTVSSGTVVHLSTTEQDATIYYYYDNAYELHEYDPSSPIEITESCTIKAITVVDEKLASEELVLDFTVE